MKLIYLTMCAFDLAIFSGTAWLVQAFNWSPWWFVLAFIITMGASPLMLNRIGKGEK